MKYLSLLLLLVSLKSFAQEAEAFQLDSSLPKQGIVLDKAWQDTYARDTIVIDRYLNDVNITSICKWHYDRSRQLGIESIVNTSLTWRTHQKVFFNVKEKGRYWFRFTIFNNDSRPLYFYICSSSIDVARIKLYSISNQGIDSSIVTGNTFPASKRPLSSGELWFRIPFNAKQHRTFYLYMERGSLPVQTSISAENAFTEGRMDSSRIHYFYKGLTSGIALLYSIIALLIFLFFPQKINFGYALYCIGGVAYLSSSLGVGISFIWRESAYFEGFSAYFFAAMQFIGLTIMARVVLQTSTRYKYIDQYLKLSLVVGSLYCFFGFWRYLISESIFAYISLFAAGILILSLIVISVLCFWDYYKFKEIQSIWFFTIFGFVIIFAILLLLTELGVIARTQFVNGHMPQLVTIVEATLATAFIAMRINNQLLAHAHREIKLYQQRQDDLERIARDLHDELGSTLSSISILSESYLRSGQIEVDKSRFGNLGDKARAALESISDIVWSVNPENDSMEKLLARMSSYAAEMLENAGAELLFQVGENLESVSLPMEKRKDFYLIFKEAVHNCAKYAHAKHIEIHLEVKNNTLHLSIKDDGIGFDPHKVENPGMGGNGLKNMQRRTAAIGGTFSIHSNPGEGVTLHVAVPLVP